MIAGLLFATDDADDRPDKLAATLPFGGVTLIEFQARLLISLGVSQLLVAVSRLTPELLGAVNRITRRGVSVDVVRSAAEAAQKVHPLARILVLADGLVTTEATVATVAGEGGDALLVTDDEDALPGFERVDAESLWAGVARIGPQRLVDAAALPKEYDFQSTLLRVVAQGGAERIELSRESVRSGHGIERDSAALTARSRSALAALVANRPAWIDRFVLAPLARLALPPLVARAVPSIALSATGGVLAFGGWTLLAYLWPVTGLALGIAAILSFTIGKVLCWLRGEDRHAHFQDWALISTAALSTLLLGRATSIDQGSATGWLAAIALVVAAALAERAANDRIRRRWWGSPAAYALLLLPFAIAGRPLLGLAIVAGYATITLGAAIETLREKP